MRCWVAHAGIPHHQYGSLYLRRDNGRTSTHRTISFSDGDYVTSVKMARFPGGAEPAIYVGTGFGRVWRSGDLGANWTMLKDFLPNTVRDFALDPASYRRTGEVWETSDTGRTRTEIGQSLKDNQVNALVLSGSALLAGTSYGVLRYHNGDWSPAGTGLPNVSVNDRELSEDGKCFFAATYGRGLWSSCDAATRDRRAEGKTNRATHSFAGHAP